MSGNRQSGAPSPAHCGAVASRRLIVQGPGNRRALALLAFALASIAGLLVLPAAGAAKKFERGSLPLENKRIFDLGVVDYDGDGILDVFTANHMFQETLLRGLGDYRYDDVYGETNFSPTWKIPGMTAITKRPKLKEPGLYFFIKARRKRPNIRIRTYRLDKVADVGPSVSGEFTVVYPKVRVIRKENASLDVETINDTKTKIRFTASDDANIVIRANHIAIPFETRFDEPLPPANIFLGSQAVPAKHRSLPTIELGDRHGAGWGDYDYDGRIDNFFVGGGVAGKIDELPGILQDELLLNKGGRGFVNATDGAGLRKGPCRGRESLPADVNKDDSLDLLVGCRDGKPRLYVSTGKGKFRNASNRVKNLGRTGTALRWADLDNDRHMELIEAGEQFVNIWKLGRSGRARLRQRVHTRNDNKNVEAIGPGDFDNDGDLDLFIAAPSGNTLLINRGGRLDARDPSSVGLPSGGSSTASWVDFNNDSKLDLYAMPDGLFKGTGKRFRRTKMLRSAGTQRFGRATWFDADNDGRRDLVTVVQRGTGPNPNSRLFKNQAARKRRWLELDLVGSTLNRQAIGARVTLKAGKRTLTQWVGQNEGSRYGSGQYRLYFGLGHNRVARQVTVRWPEGGKTKLGKVKSNRVKTVRR